jgi:propanol-preferring alcohol dehydrogenase
MRAYRFDPATRAAALAEVGEPLVGTGELLLHVEACGLCRTDLHVLDSDLVPPRPVTLGHQIVGTVVAAGAGADIAMVGRTVGVPWLGQTCGACAYCTGGRENLCPKARFTGLDRDGGLADLVSADARFCLPLPPGFAAVQAAPLLCAGLIGWRALRLAGDAPRLGIYGFGAAAHLLAQVITWQGRRLYAFTRPGDLERQALARRLGAVWAGGSDEHPPEPLDAAILFAAAGELVPAALGVVAPGGTVVCGEIHMSDIPSFPYALLWQERQVRSVANLTRRDGEELLALAPRVPLRAEVSVFPLAEIDRAITALRAGQVVGAAVVVP